MIIFSQQNFLQKHTEILTKEMVSNHNGVYYYPYRSKDVSLDFELTQLAFLMEKNPLVNMVFPVFVHSDMNNIYHYYVDILSKTILKYENNELSEEEMIASCYFASQQSIKAINMNGLINGNANWFKFSLSPEWSEEKEASHQNFSEMIDATDNRKAFLEQNKKTIIFTHLMIRFVNMIKEIIQTKNVVLGENNQYILDEWINTYQEKEFKEENIEYFNDGFSIDVREVPLIRFNNNMVYSRRDNKMFVYANKIADAIGNKHVNLSVTNRMKAKIDNGRVFFSFVDVEKSLFKEIAKELINSFGEIEEYRKNEIVEFYNTEYSDIAKKDNNILLTTMMNNKLTLQNVNQVIDTLVKNRRQEILSKKLENKEPDSKGKRKL